MIVMFVLVLGPPACEEVGHTISFSTCPSRPRDSWQPKKGMESQSAVGLLNPETNPPPFPASQ